MAKQLASSDQRVRVIRLDNNAGTWIAKNAGLKHARGEFITMHDADDWSHPAKLTLQMEPLLRDRKVMCSSSYFFRVSEETGRPFTRNAKSLLRWNPSSLLFRREVIEELGDYFPNLLGGDCEFAARIETRWGSSKMGWPGSSRAHFFAPSPFAWKRTPVSRRSPRSTTRGSRRSSYW